jgi:hypothetical protein
MSARRTGVTATPALAELALRGRTARAESPIALSRDGLLSDLLVDELADELLKRLADGLADRLSAQIAHLVGAYPQGRQVPPIPDGAQYATSEQLAARFQVSVQWVESRAANLGATPISDSANSKLRYHLATADAYMHARRRRRPPTGMPGGRGRRAKPRKRTHTRTGRPLLDVE